MALPFDVPSRSYGLTTAASGLFFQEEFERIWEDFNFLRLNDTLPNPTIGRSFDLDTDDFSTYFNFVFERIYENLNFLATAKSVTIPHTQKSRSWQLLTTSANGLFFEQEFQWIYEDLRVLFNSLFQTLLFTAGISLNEDTPFTWPLIKFRTNQLVPPDFAEISNIVFGPNFQNIHSTVVEEDGTAPLSWRLISPYASFKQKYKILPNSADILTVYPDWVDSSAIVDVPSDPIFGDPNGYTGKSLLKFKILRKGRYRIIWHLGLKGISGNYGYWAKGVLVQSQDIFPAVIFDPIVKTNDDVILEITSIPSVIQLIFTQWIVHPGSEVGYYRGGSEAFSGFIPPSPELPQLDFQIEPIEFT